MASNPFTPTFGVVPAFMAGREDITSELLAALEEGVGNPNLTTIIFRCARHGEDGAAHLSF